MNNSLWFRYGLVAVWMTVIFLFSAQDADSSGAQSGFVVDLLGTVTNSEGNIETFLVRKAAHICAYFVLGLLLYNMLQTHALSGRKIVLASIAITCVYALTDELHQVYVPGRSGEIRDVLIDTTAASLAVGLCSLSVYLSRRWSKKGIINRYDESKQNQNPQTR